MTVTIPTWLLMIPAMYFGMGTLLYWPICRVSARRISTGPEGPTTTANFMTCGLVDREPKLRAFLTVIQFGTVVVMWPAIMKDLL